VKGSEVKVKVKVVKSRTALAAKAPKIDSASHGRINCDLVTISPTDFQAN